MPNNLAPDGPAKDVKGAWAECSPETVPNFTAVGFFFGKRLREELDVPVGLIKTAWGGTPAEAWTRSEALEAEPRAAPYVEAWKKKVDDWFANVQELLDKAPFKKSDLNLFVTLPQDRGLRVRVIGGHKKFENILGAVEGHLTNLREIIQRYSSDATPPSADKPEDHHANSQQKK